MSEKPAAPAATHPPSTATLKGAWIEFCRIVLNPWNAILIISLGVMFWVSQSKEMAPLNPVIQILLTLASGVLGARIAKHLDALAEGNVLLARGRTAVRSLKLLLRTTSLLEARVASFLNNRSHIESNPDLTARNYEEIISSCRLLQEETVSSIENWTDIVSEANISTVIGVITDLKAEIDGKEAELHALQEARLQDQVTSAGQREELERDASRRAAELSQLRRELSHATTQLAGALQPVVGLGRPSALALGQTVRAPFGLSLATAMGTSDVESPIRLQMPSSSVHTIQPLRRPPSAD